MNFGSATLSFRQKKVQWGHFLEQMIFLDSGVYNRLPRHRAIFTFVNDGIMPFVEGNGYTWNLSEKELTNVILNILFEMKQGKNITIPNKQLRYSNEHYERFLRLLEPDILDEFWSVWGQMEDFHEDGYAYRFRFFLPNLIWNSLNLEHSDVTKEIETELEEQKAFEENLRKGQIPKGKDDPYLQDIQQGLGVRDKHTY